MENGVGGTYHYGPTIKESALLACESVFGHCLSKTSVSACQNNGYHGAMFQSPSHYVTMWNYANQDTKLGCGWNSYSGEGGCKKGVILSVDGKTWKPSCADGEVKNTNIVNNIIPTLNNGKLIHYHCIVTP